MSRKLLQNNGKETATATAKPICKVEFLPYRDTKKKRQKQAPEHEKSKFNCAIYIGIEKNCKKCSKKFASSFFSRIFASETKKQRYEKETYTQTV